MFSVAARSTFFLGGMLIAVKYLGKFGVNIRKVLVWCAKY